MGPEIPPELSTELDSGWWRGRANTEGEEGARSGAPVSEEDGMYVPEMIARRCRGRRDLGMSTAEYAVGTVAAAAFAGLLFKIVTSPEVRRMLLAIIHRALSMVG